MSKLTFNRHLHDSYLDITNVNYKTFEFRGKMQKNVTAKVKDTTYIPLTPIIHCKIRFLLRDFF